MSSLAMWNTQGVATAKNLYHGATPILVKPYNYHGTPTMYDLLGGTLNQQTIRNTGSQYFKFRLALKAAEEKETAKQRKSDKAAGLKTLLEQVAGTDVRGNPIYDTDASGHRVPQQHADGSEVRDAQGNVIFRSTKKENSILARMSDANDRAMELVTGMSDLPEAMRAATRDDPRAPVTSIRQAESVFSRHVGRNLSAQEKSELAARLPKDLKGQKIRATTVGAILQMADDITSPGASSSSSP